MKVLPIVGLFLGSLFLVKTVNAADYFIAANGNDSASGTIQSPWKTLQKGANTAAAGDRVFVRGGIYPQGAQLNHSGTAGAPIIFQAYPSEVVQLSGGVRAAFRITSNVSYVEIRNFTIKNYLRCLEFEFGSHLTISGNTISDCSEFGILVSDGSYNVVSGNSVARTGSATSGYTGIFSERLTNSIIEKNSVTQSRHNGIMLSYQSDYNEIRANTSSENSCGNDQQYAGIAVEVDSEYNKVYNNIIYNNCHSGFLTNSPNNYIYHNVIHNNQGAQILMGDWISSAPSNNIFKNNSISMTRVEDIAVGFGLWDGINYDPLSNMFDYNVYYSPAGPAATDLVRNFVNTSTHYTFSQWQQAGKEAHGLFTDPHFVDATNFNFQLQPVSLAIDAGINVGILTDYTNVTRPQGNGFDIGAFEYRAAEPSSRPIVSASPLNSPSPSDFPGDANGDGQVNLVDLQIWISNYARLLTSGSASADFNRDQKVNSFDFTIWATYAQ
jgi:parallel beta-helix repeat protein